MRSAWTAVAVGVVLLAAPVRAGEKPLKTRRDQVSYAMAVAMARSVQRQGVEVDVSVFAQGMSDALRGGALLMTQAEMREALAGVLGELKERQRRAAEPAPSGERTAR
jgi:FKBP-type peptidyl-prolyl isomerase-like protein